MTFHRFFSKNRGFPGALYIKYFSKPNKFPTWLHSLHVQIAISRFRSYNNANLRFTLLSLSLFSFSFFFSCPRYNESPRSLHAVVSKLNEDTRIFLGEGIRRKTRNVRVIKAKGTRVKTALPFDANRAAQTGLLGEKDPISFFHFPPLGAIRRAEKRIYDYNWAADKSDARRNANEQKIHRRRVEEIHYRIDAVEKKRRDLAVKLWSTFHGLRIKWETK